MIKTLKRSFHKNKIIYFSYLAAVVLFLLVMVIVPGFGRGHHFKVLINEAAIIGILALGQTFVILTGGIDLSIPWNLNSAGILLTFVTKSSNDGLVWLIPVILIVCSFFGLLNGIGVAYLGIPPIIMTLGMNGVLQGALLVLLKGTPGGIAPSFIADFSVGTTAGTPNLFLVWLVIGVLAVILLHYTSYGRRLFAMGNNEKVAFFSGIKVKRLKMSVYIVSGFAAGLGGILLTGRIGQSYLGMGEPYLFLTVISVVLGGASLMGGKGSYIGTIAGTSILVILTGFLAAMKLPTSVQQILYGIILMVAVILIPSDSKKE